MRAHYINLAEYSRYLGGKHHEDYEYFSVSSGGRIQRFG